jgi:EmrB/QacA subfamily drug resistance transporter
MSTAFKTDLSTIQWVVTAYLLAQAAVIPVAGYFGNRVGIKRLFMACLALFTIGSVLCGLSQTESMLIFFRVLQGLGGGALFPLATAIAFAAFLPRERAAASAIIAIPVLLAPVFGPTIGGWLIVTYGWQWIFFVNLPVGIAALLMAWFILPADKLADRQTGKGFDYVGLALVTLGTVAYPMLMKAGYGKDAAGGESGPDLTRSKLVNTDQNGDKIGPVVRNGRAEKGMPPFDLSEAQINGLVAFIHTQQGKAASQKGERRASKKLRRPIETLATP